METNNISTEDKCKQFLYWLNLEYRATKVFGDEEEVAIYEKITDRFKRIFNDEVQYLKEQQLIR